ncbi:MAG: hypothetical protein IIA67_10590 [Planctomycetes bacterium]|nr:hypothetical protein [Planctomycetota bacterium]
MKRIPLKTVFFDDDPTIVNTDGDRSEFYYIDKIREAVKLAKDPTRGMNGVEMKSLFDAIDLLKTVKKNATFLLAEDSVYTVIRDCCVVYPWIRYFDGARTWLQDIEEAETCKVAAVDSDKDVKKSA